MKKEPKISSELEQYILDFGRQAMMLELMFFVQRLLDNYDSR